MPDDDMVKREAFRALTRKLADEGRVLDAGWASLYKTVIVPEFPIIQKEELRAIFMCGARHLLLSIMALLDTSEETTPADLSYMDKIYAEMEAYHNELLLRYTPTKGSS